jgi:hypothetical protein
MNRLGLTVAALTMLCAAALSVRCEAQQTTTAQSTAAPAPTASPNQWQFKITPYIWAPTINASFQFTHPTLPLGSIAVNTVGVRLGPNGYLSHLNSAAMLSFEAGKNDGSVFADVIYLNLSNTGASVVDLTGPLGHIHLPINVSTAGRVTATISTIGIGPTLVDDSSLSAQGFVGFRYLNTTATADWTLTGPLGLFPRVGSASESVSDLAGIFGVRGRFHFGHGWFVPLYGDYGGSGGLTTYQFFAGIAHEYHSGAQILVWRDISYLQNNTGLIQNMHLGGPTFAWSVYL